MKASTKKLSVLVVAGVLALSLALVGCSSPAPAASGAASGSATTASGSSTSTPAAASITDKNWLGDWTSSSEIVPPETATQQYTLVTNDDGSFTINDNGKELYSGTFTDTNAEKGAGWGTATIDGKTINLQLVNAQGAYKLIFNAGDDWDKSLKKIVFI